jgi:CubicO group peptidase (beta-lactamase class C family)
MNFDEMQKAWQAEGAQARLMVDADLLLKEVQRNQRSFAATIFCRDVREIGVALVMVPVWIFLGIQWTLPWTWYLCVPTLLWIAGFMYVDRRRQRQREARAGNTLREQIETSLAQVEHQIWLLRNVLWWYLLPLWVAIVIFFGHSAWQREQHGESAIATTAGTAAVTAFVFWFVYWLNQYCVRKQLEPRRQELKSLLASLGGTATDQPTREEPGKSRSRMWPWVVMVLCAAAVLAAVVGPVAGQLDRGAFAEGICPVAGDASITNILARVQQKHRVPAIAAVVVTSEGLARAAVAGVRKNGTTIPVTLEDKWHLGSDGKAMTAVLVARLVEEGRLKWDTTVSEVFPELAAGFQSEAARITVMQLLTHRSGLRANPNLRDYLGLDGTKERLRLVENELSKRPSHPPGTHYEYSNIGYAIAGAMTEKITGRSWEEALRGRVFEPLGMTSVGFGGTGTAGKIDQPWGHSARGTPVGGNGPAMDNPPVLGPAGRIHCTIQDWAKFVADQLRGARGQRALLKPETYRILQTPPAGGDYALGWGVRERGWGGGTVLQHTGDNTMNFANVWLAPHRDFAVLACLNQSGNTAFLASDDAISSLIKIHLQRTTNTTDLDHSPNRLK